MKITKRERGLLTITVTVILVGINYLVVIPLLRSRTLTNDKLKSQRAQLTVMQETIKRKPDWQKQYDGLREGLGKKTEPFNLGSDVEKKIVEVATSSGVQLTSRRSMTVEDKGVYRVFPVQCGVEATTDSLVNFLFALQSGAGFMSVEQLQIAPKPDNPNILRCDILVRALTSKMGRPGFVNRRAYRNAALLTALAVGACCAIARAVDETHDFGRYKIIIDRAPFGAVSGAAADVQQPPFSARFTFIGMAEEDGQPLMAIILDKEGNRVHFKAEGESIGPVVVVKIEKADKAPARVILKQALEVATLSMESKPGIGAPPAAAPSPVQPGQPPVPGGAQPGIRRIPFARPNK